MHIFKRLFDIYLLFIAVFFIGRSVLYLQYLGRMEDLSLAVSLQSFVYGLRLDTIIACVFLVLPAIVMTVAPRRLEQGASRLIKGYVLLLLLLVIFIENATLPFFAQYDVRPNYLFVEYLKYPTEVSSMILKDYPVQLLVAGLLMVLAAWGYLRYFRFEIGAVLELAWWRRLLLFPLIVLVLFAGIRSSFGHRPANISDALYSENQVANEIAKNSFYSVAYAYSQNAREIDVAQVYGRMDRNEAYARVSRVLNIPVGSDARFNRLEPTHFRAPKPRNLVLLIEESMGAQFVGFSGGDAAITPNLQRLHKEGLAFSNLYSNGTRSIRGLAGVSAGFLPLPGEGVVKRNKSQRGFFTVAQLLKPLGYKSSFIYGGESRFDNMRSWFLGNGFDFVVEQKDYLYPSFVSTWGVSDEDLLRKAHEIYQRHHDAGEPFVSVIFSSSNHAPFELPEGKIEYVPGKPKKGVENAVRYADYAIGQFFDLAKKSPYYQDTVFVVVADHNVRVYGDDVVPVNMFHIPAMIIAPGLKPQIYDKLATQPDVLATALDLVGIDLRYPILGHSIYSDAKREGALMMFNDTYALRVGDQVAVAQPRMPTQTFRYVDSRLQPASSNPELEQDVLAFVTVLDDLYKRALYR